MSHGDISFPQEVFVKLAKAEDVNWWFQSRKSIIIWILKKYRTSIQKYLEVGCGTGFVLRSVSENFPDSEVTGAEYFDKGLNFAKQRAPKAIFRQLDVTQMSDCEGYDVIGAFDVLEHIEDDNLVLKGLIRALKPGGHLIVTVPQHQWLWSPVDLKAGHFRRYSASEIKAKMKAAGFDVNYSSSFVFLLLPAMWVARFRARNKKYDEAHELDLPWILNRLFMLIMNLEFLLLKIGFRLPWGGSLLVVASKSVTIQSQ